MPDAENIAILAKALAHPARIRVLRPLLATPGCIGGTIVTAVGRAQSAVCNHLRILKAAGIIPAKIDRPRVCSALDAATLQPRVSFIAGLTASDRKTCRSPETLESA